MAKKSDYDGKDFDKPVDNCPHCGCGMWISTLTGTLLYSCNCASNIKQGYVKKENINKWLNSKLQE